MAAKATTKRKRAKDADEAATVEPVAAETTGASAPETQSAPKKSESAYVVFARRFRPRSFSDVVGQAAATGALRQALSTGRVAQAYLFCGPRGVGKTSLARIVAKALNCLNGKGLGGVAEEPCNACHACEAIQEGRALDVIEMDAATNRGIEEVRALRENVGFAPAELRYKVYIIDEVHMLTREAWNAFLKTLEEPPPHVKFIFATTDPNNVPETILSRCQRFDLRRIGPADIVMRLKQICALDSLEFEEAALSRIAGLARGGLRDAEGLLDQAINLSQGQVTDAIVRELSGAAPDELISEILLSCASGSPAEALTKAHQALEAGADPEDLLAALLERLRGALLSQVCGENSALLEGQIHLKAAYAELSKRLNADQTMMLMQLFTAARRQMRDAAQTRLPLEMALVRASRAGELVDLGRLVSALEAPGNPPAQRAPPPPQTPSREGYRPNLPGRPVGTLDSRPAASTAVTSPVAVAPPSVAVKPAGTPALPASSGVRSEQWTQIVSSVASLKGCGLLAGALSHAQSVRFDGSARSLALGFTSGQLFYREALEKPQNQALLLPILKAALGAEVQLVFERAASGTGGAPAFPAPPSANVARTPQLAPVRAGLEVSAGVVAPPEFAEGQIEETEIEFDGEGELPLREPPALARASEAAEVVAEEATPRLPVPSLARPAPPIQPSPAELKAFESYPLIKNVLRETDGIVIGVTRK